MNDAKLIIFDLDGTLIDAYPAIIKSFNFVMKKFKYPEQKPLVIRRAVGWGDDNLLKPFIKEKDLKKMLLFYRRDHKVALVKRSKVLPGAIKILSYLKNKGYRLAIASNRPTEFSWILIRHLGLRKYFDYVLCADKLKYIKPHPEILNKIMQRFKVSSKETIYVGDMNIDAQAGRRAGVKTVMVTTGSSTRKEIRKEHPYLIISEIKQLQKVI